MTKRATVVLSVAQVDDLLSRQLIKQLAGVRESCAVAEAFSTNPRRLSARILARHSAEHVVRIRQFRPLDNEAARLIACDYPKAAITWAKYVRSEAVHDRYFLRDLEAMGISRDFVDRIEPFNATLQLTAYMREAMEVYGPLPVVLYSFWVEKHSEIGSTLVIDGLRAQFGDAAVRGASAHRALDDNLGHADVVGEVLTMMLDADKLFEATEILGAISKFIAAYFHDLEEFDRLWGRGIDLAGEYRAASG